VDYVVDFRGKPACPCLASWLPVFEQVLLARGVIRESLDIAQLIGGAAASGGTHATGGAFDVWQHDAVTVAVARQMGAAAWARTPAQGFDPHTHGVLRGCPHNEPGRYQIAALDAGYNGLGYGGRGAPDDGPRPVPARTWQQGIEWARTQLEDTMTPAQEKKLDGLVTAVQSLADTVEKLADREAKRAEQAKTQRSRIVALVRDGKATTEDILAALADQEA
jgi:hypothetical protein